MLSDFNILDDSGCLALVDVSLYESFVGSDWDFPTLKSHVDSQAKLGRIAFWECEDGGSEYRIRRTTEILSLKPILDSTITAGKEGLFLVSYSALTMAAQFETEFLPSTHEKDLNLEVTPGDYNLKVYRHFDPDDYEFPDESGPHFSLKLEKLD